MEGTSYLIAINHPEKSIPEQHQKNNEDDKINKQANEKGNTSPEKEYSKVWIDMNPYIVTVSDTIHQSDQHSMRTDQISRVFHLYQIATENNKGVLEQFVDANGKVWLSEEYLKEGNGLNSSVVEVHKSELHSVRTEQFFGKNTSNLYQIENDDSKNVFEQFVDENGQVWRREEYLKEWMGPNPCAIEPLHTLFDSQSSHILKRVIEKEHNYAKIDHFREENSPYLSHNVNEDCKNFIQQFIDESGQLWTRDENLKESDLSSVKLEISEGNLHDDSEMYRQEERSEAGLRLFTKIEPNEICETSNQYTGCHRLPEISSLIEVPTEYGNTSVKEEDAQYSNLKFSSHEEYLLKQHVDIVQSKLLNYTKCNFCDIVCHNRFDLELHVKLAHVESNGVEDNLCDMSSSNRNNFNSRSKLIKCVSCNSCFYSKYKLKLHVNSVHLKLRFYKCNFCDYISKSDEQLKSHEYVVHLKLRIFNCHMCDKSFRRKITLKEHIDEVHSKLKTFRCHLCKYGTSLIRKLRFHVNYVHLRLRDEKCDSCGFMCTSKHKLLNHINSVHLKLKPFKCHSCDRCFGYKNSLKQHINKFHSVFKAYECRLCDFRAITSRHLSFHIRTVHLESYLVFPSKVQFQKHTDVVHLPSKRHKCRFCNFSSTSSDELIEHKDSVHENLKVHKCNSCDFRSSSWSVVRLHLDSVHIKMMPFKCHLCDTCFVEKYELEQHVDLTHAELKTFQCHTCNFVCILKHDLIAHMNKVHWKLSSFKCSLCKKCFREKKDLKKHIELVHFI